MAPRPTLPKWKVRVETTAAQALFIVSAPRVEDVQAQVATMEFPVIVRIVIEAWDRSER